MSNFESKEFYSVGYEPLFSKCEEAIRMCEFTLEESEPAMGRIQAKTKMNLWTLFGEDITIFVSKDGSVSADSQCSQFFDYGKNKENIEKFFTNLRMLLNSSPVRNFSANNAPAPPPVQNSSVELLDKHNVREETRIVGTEEMPLDNRQGSHDLTIEHEFSKMVSNQLSVKTSGEINLKVGFDLLALKNEILAKLSREIGNNLEETVTRRCKLTFVVKPKDFIIYKIIWKQKRFIGDYEIMFNNQRQLIPFEASFGLEYEISSRPGVK